VSEGGKWKLGQTIQLGCLWVGGEYVSNSNDYGSGGSGEAGIVGDTFNSTRHCGGNAQHSFGVLSSMLYVEETWTTLKANTCWVLDGL